MCSRVHQSADPFVVRNLIEKSDALPSQDLLVFRKNPSGEIVDGYLRWDLPTTRLHVPKFSRSTREQSRSPRSRCSRRRTGSADASFQWMRSTKRRRVGCTNFFMK